MIKFVIRENDEHYNIADNTDGYFIRAFYHEECLPFTRFINIAKCLEIDCCSFNKVLSSYGGLHQSYSYSNEVYTVDVLYFRNKENAERFIKEYLEPQLIATKLL